VEVKYVEKNIILRFIAPSISKERSTLFFNFIEGALTSFEYEIIEKNDYKGIIVFKITRIS